MSTEKSTWMKLPKRLAAPIAAVGVGVGLTAGVTAVAQVASPSAASKETQIERAAEAGAEPATERRVVAKGSDAEFGRWTLFASSNAAGEPCVTLHRPDVYKDLPPEALVPNAKYPGEMDESCGPEITQMITVYGKSRTLVVGSLPAQASEQRLTVAGHSAALATVPDAASGRGYYVRAVEGANPGPISVEAMKGTTQIKQNAPGPR